MFTPKTHPICPNCKRDPLTVGVTQGPMEMNLGPFPAVLIISQMWCDHCGVLLAAQIMQVLTPEQAAEMKAAAKAAAEGAAGDLGGGKSKLWKPS